MLHNTYIFLSFQDGDGISIPSAYDTLPPPTGKFSMMEFAMLYFRKSPYRYTETIYSFSLTIAIWDYILCKLFPIITNNLGPFGV